MINQCPSCFSEHYIKSGIIKERQRYKCKSCGYNFTVNKSGKSIDSYYVCKALQLYLEGLSYREIERILGISHVTVMNWVKKYKIKRPHHNNYHPTYKILSKSELSEYFSASNQNTLSGSGILVTELGDKYMLIKWERFRD